MRKEETQAEREERRARALKALKELPIPPTTIMACASLKYLKDGRK